MISLGENPFAAPIIPSFRTFKISITSDSQPGVDGTVEFVTTLKAIHTVHPPPPVKVRLLRYRFHSRDRKRSPEFLASPDFGLP